jgi:ATP-dependent Clp protease, protease subunit
VVDALDMMRVEVHATCLGTITGAAVAILAVADRRTAGPHHDGAARAPSPPPRRRTRPAHPRRTPPAQAAWAAGGIATACHRLVDTVIADMRAGRLLTAEQARDYGLIDSFTS